MTKLTWLRVGATWTEIVRDTSGIKPVESFVTYRVTTVPEPDSDGSAEIEKHTKSQDDDDTSSYSAEDLINEGTLLDLDPEHSELVEINGDPFFVEKTEVIQAGSGGRSCYKLIRKVRGECPRCGGSGECSDCSNSGECPTCGGNSQCNECSGEGKCNECSGEGKCYSCDGSGRCSNCEGKGRIDSGNGPGDPCDSCQGTGKCENCQGTGKCPTCKGTMRCIQCNGTGKCFDCHGSGKCPFCNGSLKCRECQGATTAKTTDEFWYDIATGILLRATKTINTRVIGERKVSSLGVGMGSSPQTSFSSSGQDSGPATQPMQYTPVLPPPPGTGRPLQIPDVCPGCGKSLKAVGTPVFCPFCGTKLLH